jgi:hypothetical protein
MFSVASDADSAEAHYNLAKLLALQGHADNALNELRDGLFIDPTQVEARLLMGNL